MGWRDFAIKTSDNFNNNNNKNTLDTELNYFNCLNCREGDSEKKPFMMPYLEPNGNLVIPFESDSKYHWWKAGQSVSDTISAIINKGENRNE